MNIGVKLQMEELGAAPGYEGLEVHHTCRGVLSAQSRSSGGERKGRRGTSVWDTLNFKGKKWPLCVD